MSLLPMIPAVTTEAAVSAACWVELDVLAEQIHFSDAADTERFLAMFLHDLAEEKLRWRAAWVAHDWPAADAAAAEMRDLTALAAVCRDHLKATRYVRS